MAYSIIDPPFTLRFSEMPKSDLVAYASWFHSVAPERVAELAAAVRSTAGFEQWEPNETPGSLEALGRWFEGQAETRAKTPKEISEQRGKLVFQVAIPAEQLTNRTFSVAWDVAFYFAQVVLRHVPGTRWDQQFGSKKWADYGQPIIVGSGVVPLNPLGVMVSSAYGIAHGKRARLRELFDVWTRMLGGRPASDVG